MATTPYAHVKGEIENGITHLNSLMEGLNTVTPSITDTKNEIHHLNEHFKRAEQKIEGKISELTKECLDEEAKLSNAQSRLRAMQTKERNLQNNLQRTKDNQKRQENLLEEAKEEVKSKQRVVDRKREEYNQAVEHQNNTNIAATVLAFVPLVNLITTPVLLAVSFTAMQSAIADAESDIDSAKESLSQADDDYKEILKTCNETIDQIQSLNEQISEQERQITSCLRKIQDLRAEKNDENKTLQNLRNLNKEISKLAGRAEVLEQESRLLYDVSTLYKPLKSIVTLLSDPSSGIPVCASHRSFWKQVLSGDGFRAIAMNDEWI